MGTALPTSTRRLSASSVRGVMSVARLPGAEGSRLRCGTSAKSIAEQQARGKVLGATRKVRKASPVAPESLVATRAVTDSRRSQSDCGLTSTAAATCTCAIGEEAIVPKRGDEPQVGLIQEVLSPCLRRLQG